MEDSYRDVQTSSNEMRVYLFSPVLPATKIPKGERTWPGVVVFSEIYQVTPPVKRLCRQIAGRGYLVACPSSYHEYEGTRAMDYSPEDTALGNDYKVRKRVAAFDEDASLTINLLASLGCKRIGATGICLGGHLAYRASFDARVSACVTFFATDIHASTLGSEGKHENDSLSRTTRRENAHCELMLIFGRLDGHVPRAGRDLIRQTLDDAEATFSWFEIAGAAHAFVRDEGSRGRFDPAITDACLGLLFEVFSRNLF